jgi:hypothetical protein
MAYNTTTERLLNAIKNNTANITIDASGGITVDNTALIAAIEAQDDNIADTATNTATINTSVQALQGDNTSTAENTLYELIAASKAIQETTETLQDVIDAIDGQDADLLTTANNSNTSLGKNGFSFHNASASTQSGKAAVQFLTESVVLSISGTSITGTVAGTLPAGTIIYGDITAVSISSGSFILYNV